MACLLWSIATFGQDTARYEIRYVSLYEAILERDIGNSVVKEIGVLPAPDGVNESQIVRLDFFDRQEGKVVKSFDVVANSPFESLNYSKIGINTYGCSIYRVEKILSEDSSLCLKKSIPNQHSIYDSMPEGPYEVHSMVYVTGGNDFAAISYECIVKKMYDGFTGVEGMIGEDVSGSLYFVKVINSKGEVIHEFPNRDLEGSPIVEILDDGKYGAVEYSICDRWDCSPPVRQGLKFISLENGKIIDFPISLEEKICCAFKSEGGLFFYLTEIWRTPLVRDEVWRVFDIKKMIYYEKVISDSERRRLRKWGPGGFEYKYPDRHGVYTYTLEHDFKKISIQEP